MSVSLSPGIIGVFSSLSSTSTMTSKRAGSKDTVQSTTRDAIDQMSMSFPTQEDIRLFVDKNIKIS